MEGLRQMQRGFVQRELVDGGPQIQNIALSCALRMEAAEDLFVQSHRERTLIVLPLFRRAVKGAGAAPLEAVS